MTLYELLNVIGKSILGLYDGHILTERLKETLNDNGDFLRNRYCKRQEGLVPNREIGKVNYILFSYNGVLTSDSLEEDEVIDYQISWVNNDIFNINEELEWELQFSYSKILVIVADNYKIGVDDNDKRRSR